MKYAVACLDFDNGLEFQGPFDTKDAAHTYLETSGLHVTVHCEVMELAPCELLSNDWGHPMPGDVPHVIATGTFAKGYTLHGPFVAREAAEWVSDEFPEYVHIAPLLAPAATSE